MTTPHRNSFLSNRPHPPIKASDPPQPPLPTSTSTTTETPKPKFTPPPPNSPAFISIPVLSLPRATSFYRSVFGWTFQSPSPTQVIFFTPSSIMGSLSLTSPTSEVVDGEKETEGAGAVVEKRAGGVVNFILVTDVAATLERVKEAGGEVERERWVEGGHTELGRYWDSEGNLGGVLKWLI